MSTVKSLNIGEIFDKKTTKENMNKPIMRISGIVYSEFTHLGKYGESTGFKGDFAGVNYLTGEIYDSNACFLPRNLTQEISKRLADGKGMEVEFDTEIRAIESSKNDKGYAWVADAPQTAERQSRQLALQQKMKKIASEKKQLPSPEKAGNKKTAA